MQTRQKTQSIFESMLTEMIDGRSLNDFVGGGDPEGIGSQNFEILKNAGVIRPDSRVFDLGSGCGRVAVPIAQFLNGGKYVGGDIVPPLVEFCQRKIAPRFRNTSFFVLDEDNPLYPVTGHTLQKHTISEVCKEMDLVIAFSVFTHFDEEMTRRHLAAIYDGLVYGGFLVMSCFLLNAGSRERIDDGLARFPFDVASRTFSRFDKPGKPLHAVAYDQDYLCAMATEAGFYVNQVQYGAWSGQFTAATFQDVCILQKAPRLPRDFDAAGYLRLNADVKASGADPKGHWLTFGYRENRRWK